MLLLLLSTIVLIIMILMVMRLLLHIQKKIIKEWIYHFLWEENSNSLTIDDPSTDNSKEYLYRNFENKDEIIVFKQKLWEFGITLRDLFFLGPREVDQIMFSLNIAKTIAGSKILYKNMFNFKTVPIDDLDEKIRIQKKLIEKNKEYIIALSIILKSDLKVLKSYLINIEQGKPTENIGIILELFKKDAIVMNFSGQFVIIKVDRSNNRIIGKQVQLNKDGSKLYSSNFLKFGAIAAGSVAVIMVIMLGSKAFLNRSNETVSPSPSSKVIVLDDPKSEDETDSETGDIEVPVATEVTDDTKISPTPATVEQAQSPIAGSPLDPSSNSGNAESSTPISSATPAKTPRTKPTNTKPPKPTNTTKKATPKNTVPTLKPTVKPTVKPTAKPTSKPATEAPKLAKAQGIPGSVQISSSAYSVKVGEYFTLSMNMFGGNNGTSLILYENNEVISTSSLEDKTPESQSRSVAVIAEKKGIFNYRWKLVNEFGSSSSGTLTMIVTE